MRPDMNLTMGAFVVMPNHFHAIFTIGKNEYNSGANHKAAMQVRDAMHCVPAVRIRIENRDDK